MGYPGEVSVLSGLAVGLGHVVPVLPLLFHVGFESVYSPFSVSVP